MGGRVGGPGAGWAGGGVGPVDPYGAWVGGVGETSPSPLSSSDAPLRSLLHSPHQSLVENENATARYTKLCGRKRGKPVKNDLARCSMIEIGGDTCEGCECPKRAMSDAVHAAVEHRRWAIEHSNMHAKARAQALEEAEKARAERGGYAVGRR